MRCPVCKAENTTGPQCRRCRADLSLLFALEEQRERAVASARRALGRGESGPAVTAAAAAEALRSGGDLQRLLVLGYLMGRDFARAWEEYSRTRPRE
jgi:hypothetical protein